MSNIDITAPHVLRGIPKDLREHVKAAALLGWTGRKRGQGGLVLHSPDGVHTVVIPITVNRVNTAKQIARDLVRYTPDEVKVAATEAAIDAENQGQIVSLGTVVRDAQGVFPPSMVAELVPEEVDSTETAYVTPEGVPAVHIVSVEPWMARVSSDGATSDLYESPSTLQRTWSDGSVDYMCAFCEDKYTHEKARSVVSHYANAHVTKGHVPRSGKPVPVQFDAKIDGYRTVRVAHLAKEIQVALEAMEDGSLLDTTVQGMEPLARYLAAQIVKERIARGKEKAEEEPVLSEPDEILARIKRLVLRDEVRQAEAAEERASALLSLVEETKRQRDHYKTQSEKRGAALQAMAQMAEEEAVDGD